MKRGKIKTKREIASLARRLRGRGKKIVFTNGCFDLLHAGHLRVFRRSRALGDVLIVGINSDASVRRLKGSRRPIVSQGDRAEMLAGMEPVDYVVVFGEDTPRSLIEAVRPDVLAKGGDWKKEDIVGADLVKSVRRVPILKGRSTTNVIGKILRAYGKKGK